MKRRGVSRQTRNNWLVDAALAVGALVAAVSGAYFLYLPVGGYQGGRNPAYGIHILFERHTWGDLHTWFGVLMIAAAVVHIAIHWSWVTSTVRRVARNLAGKGAPMNRRGYTNVAIDAAVGAGFVLAAASGLYFLLAPRDSGGFLLSRTTWDIVHTWAGVAMIVAAVTNFAIHWSWVTRVTRKILGAAIPDTRSGGPVAPPSAA